MTQPDCISNRNLKIIDAYVKNRLGREYDLFEGLSRPDGFPPLFNKNFNDTKDIEIYPLFLTWTKHH